MSRYYKIVVGAAPKGGTSGFMWTNLVDGKCVTGAQTVEMDLWQAGYDDPVSSGYVKIWGPPKSQIFQASDFNDAPIQIWAGMQNGLPLATASAPQSGLVASGYIFQAFGNWQGVNQTLDFVISPQLGGTQADPANISFNLTKGQPLSEAIKFVLTTALPTLDPPKIDISPNLVLSQDEPFTFDTLVQFGDYIKRLSKNIIGGAYAGVTMVKVGNRVIVFDGTQPGGPVTLIKSQDMIGQATWLDAATISFTTVLRSDLLCGSTVQFEPIAGLTAVTNANSGSNVRAKNTFNGIWQITKIRHLGNSRSKEARSWVTVFQAIPVLPTSTS